MKIINDLYKLKNTQKANILGRYFKTKNGEYGYGDKFLGITVPQIRLLVSKYWKSISMEDISLLITNEYHEIRLCGLLILVNKYKRSNGIKERFFILNLYLSNTKFINNWDLVDLSAPSIVGSYVLEVNNFEIIQKLVKSNDLWQRRIAVLSTYTLIRNNLFDISLDIINQTILNKEDLMHKASGWMLRELGKRNKNILIKYLKENVNLLSRTTLRYSIEKFSEEERKYFLSL